MKEILAMGVSDFSMQGLIVALVFYAVFCSVMNSWKLRHIPTVGGPSLPILSYYGAYRSLRYKSQVMQEGYDKYKGGMFKIAELHRWRVVLSGPKLIGELQKADEHSISFEMAWEDLLQPKYTFGYDHHEDSYHLDVVRSQLTRNLNALFPEICEEVASAFADEVPANADGWTKVNMMRAATEVVCRTSNRLFVGLQLCRNADYCNLNKQFTMEIFKRAIFINLFPYFLRPVVGWVISDVSKSIDQVAVHLAPLITERKRNSLESKGDWPNKPNDLLQWLIDDAPHEELRDARPLATRMLTINNAALHTSSITFKIAIYYLAAYPHYIQPIREEVEKVVAEEGWTKISMGKMYKLDSFIKETQRLTGIGVADSMIRMAASDFVFSDGTFVPKGTMISVPMCAIHTDGTIYSNPHDFRPFRFAEMRDKSEKEKGWGQFGMVSTSVEWLPFGHGKHACPGRFFAANEVKMMFAHFVMNYDVKAEIDGVLPSPSDLNLELLVRKRQSGAE